MLADEHKISISIIIVALRFSSPATWLGDIPTAIDFSDQASVNEVHLIKHFLFLLRNQFF